MTYPTNPPGLDWTDGDLFRDSLLDALRGCDALALTTGMTADEKRMREAKRRNGSKPSTHPDARIRRRTLYGRTFLEAKKVGGRGSRSFPDTAEGWAAARVWRDSECS